MTDQPPSFAVGDVVEFDATQALGHEKGFRLLGRIVGAADGHMDPDEDRVIVAWEMVFSHGAGVGGTFVVDPAHLKKTRRR